MRAQNDQRSATKLRYRLADRVLRSAKPLLRDALTAPFRMRYRLRLV